MTDLETALPNRQPGRASPWPRALFTAIIQTALEQHEGRFARQAALSWLGSFPGDLPVTRLYAEALVADDRPDLAFPVLENLCAADPEYREASHLLAQLRPVGSRGKGLDPLGYVIALGGEGEPAQHKGLAEQTVAAWSRLTGQARAFLEGKDLPRAEQALHQALAAQPANPLMAVTHLKILQLQARAQNAPPQALRSLAELYHQQWPDCLQCSLVYADALMDGGEAEQAVAQLHRAAARDVTGQVAVRLWGESHPYRALWPDRLEACLDLPIPAAVAAALGWNRLPAGERAGGSQNGTPVWLQIDENFGGSRVEPAQRPPAAHAWSAAQGAGKNPVPEASDSAAATAASDRPGEAPISAAPAEAGVRGTTPVERPAPVYSPVPETLRSVQAELERVAGRLRRPGLARSDGRFPVYVILTTRRGLEGQYGAVQLAGIETELGRLAGAVQARRDWRAVVFYADDGVCSYSRTSRFAIQPARPTDAWGLKLALADLDAALCHKGEMIGTVLIVGGPEVVPFHRLPNPVDDLDEEVLSDNPYGTRDENYFVPEWPVGRLPGGAGGGEPGAAQLLKSLQALTGQHMALARRRQRRPWYRNWGARLAAWLQARGVAQPSFGYTAAVWRKASVSVYRPIGEPKSMLVSPPIQAPDAGVDHPPTPRRRFQKRGPLVPPARLAYFNLHGLEDAVEWYGQRDPAESSSGRANNGPDYPVALRPQDIPNSGRAPQVVFSEACYGAHILNKTVEEALALKFLQSGSQAVVGSTCTAYGSVGTPLIAADFLGEAFWSCLRKGTPAGEALRRAKISLAQEMHRRQGYLDGEDQKTLISFVLYGDPLAQPLGDGRLSKGAWRPLTPPAAVRTVCDRARRDEPAEPLPSEVIAQVKGIVEKYLPGMADAQVTVSREHAECDQTGHKCPTAQLGGKPADGLSAVPAAKTPGRRLILLSKQVPGALHLHTHYARITLDAEDRLVKLVVSR